MLRVLLLAANWWPGASPLTVLVAQAVSGEAPAPLTSLVYSALGSSPAALILAWVVNRLEKEKAQLRADVAKERDEVKRLNESRTDSAKDMATLLERAATTFAEVKAGMDATLTKTRPDGLDRTLRELQDLLQERSKGEGRGS